MANKRRNGLSCSEAGKLGAIASKETHHKTKQIRVKKYLENPNLCKCCGCVLNYEKRGSSFCSKSCAARYNNLHRDKAVYEKQRTTLLNTIKHKSPTIIHKENISTKIDKSKETHIKKIKPKYCKYCGAIKGQCKNSWVCSKFQLFKTLQKFGFDMSVIGTEQVVDEFYRVRSIIENFYIINSSNNEKLIELFSYTSGSANFMKIIKSLNIESKSHNEAVANAWMLGRIQPVNFEGNYQYECGWHTTWDNKEVYLRSSYELEYAQELDSKQTKYDVESLRIKYFDTKENIYRCAIPDFYLPDTNTIVEIKSTWTYDEQNMKDKFKAYKELGYNTKLILDKKEVDCQML